jgi:hypothetical protein
MNRKLKHVVTRVGRASKLLFQGSYSSSNRREAMLRCVRGEKQWHPIAFQRSDDEEEEERGEEVENVGEGANEEEEEEAGFERVRR